MIPKVIHWCRFGRGRKSVLAERFIASWKKDLPDYEIKEWNDDNFDIHCNKYVGKAYLNKKLALVTDQRMTKRGLTFEDVEFEIPGYVKIFKQEVFCPKSFQDRSYHVTENSVTIHHFSTTWPPLRMRVLNWTRDHLGYWPCRILANIWSRPDKTVMRIVRHFRHSGS